MREITIGIPKSLLYYKYYELWDTFFNELGCNVVYSPDTNKEILENGKGCIIDEACLPIKIQMGHVKYLEDKCDYILLPRLECVKKDEKMCTNFNALYDLTRNIFDVKVLHYNVNVEKNKTEKKGLLEIAKVLGFDKKSAKRAYKIATEKSQERFNKKVLENKKKIKKKESLKILLVSHEYNTYDELIGKPIIRFLNTLKTEIIYAHLNNYDEKAYKKLSKSLYWTFNKELLNGIMEYKDQVDGIILLTTFPCGPDSLVNEIVLRKIDMPIINIIIDELNSETGLETRLESFVDILASKEG